MMRQYIQKTIIRIFRRSHDRNSPQLALACCVGPDSAAVPQEGVSAALGVGKLPMKQKRRSKNE